MHFQNTLNFNKRQIIREMKRYSLNSVLQECIEMINSKDCKAKWVIYLIIKWKFISTDKKQDFYRGIYCNKNKIDQWSQIIWKSESNLDNIHHFLRNMFDTQIIWQKNYQPDVFFFPSFINSLSEDNLIRKHILSRYKISITELKLLFTLLYQFRINHQNSITVAKAISTDLHAVLISIIEDLTFTWKELAGNGLDANLPYDEALIKYLASINLEENTFESTESPWLENYPIIEINEKFIFSVDSLLWQRKISNYFYEKLSIELDNFSEVFGKNFEDYCKNIILSNFGNDKLKIDLPKSSVNADFIAEDENYFYIIEIKHKKYDKNIFSLENSKRLSSHLFNQVVKGYKQIEATAQNIDDYKIFKFKRKPLNKRRIGFVITERSYKIGHGVHFTALAGDEHKIDDTHIQDKDIFFIGIQEFELLLLASRDNSLFLGDVANMCFDQRQSFIERIDVSKKLTLKSQTGAEVIKQECFDFLSRFALEQESKI